MTAHVAIIVELDPRQILELSEAGCPDSVSHKIERFTTRVVKESMRQIFGEAFLSAFVEYQYADNEWQLSNWECDSEQCTSCLHRLDCLADPGSFRPIPAALHSR